MSFRYGLTEQNAIMKILNITPADMVASVVMDANSVKITTDLSVWERSIRHCTCACTCNAENTI